MLRQDVKSLISLGHHLISMNGLIWLGILTKRTRRMKQIKNHWVNNEANWKLRNKVREKET